jgi:KamA family protein
MVKHLQPALYKAYTRRNIDQLHQYRQLPPDLQFDIQVVSAVLPFRVNAYVVEQLIDWRRVPDDPIYQLTFSQKGMLEPDDYERIATLIRQDAPANELQAAARQIQFRLNPHPAGQLSHNVPLVDGEPLPGLQHKYEETVLFFPASGQTCHAYCSYCFRWAQFIGMQDLRFAAREADQLARYLEAHPRVTDVLFTGGDPMIMKTRILRRYIEPLLNPDLAHVRTIRIGTKAVAYWPQRFVTDPDADDLLRLFEQIIASGRHVAIMGHYSHPVELQTPIAQEAIRRLRNAGCEIRMQAPLVRHVNDHAAAWAGLWRDGVKLGLIPYYMFMARDTGAKKYYEIPLVKALDVFQGAYRQLSGLGRTVRGPVMSCTPGKVQVQGVADVAGRKAFVLSLIQGRHAQWVGRPFFARYDPRATWFTDLHPMPGQTRFFFEQATPPYREHPPRPGDFPYVQRSIS